MIKLTKGNPIGEPIRIFVPGQPARVTHQSGTRIAGHRTYKTKELIEWEKRIQCAAVKARPDKPLKGPLILYATYMYETPNKKQKGSWKITKPDGDNAIKTPKDVLERLGFFEKGDQQTSLEVIMRQWCGEGEEPGLYLTIERLEDHA